MIEGEHGVQIAAPLLRVLRDVDPSPHGSFLYAMFVEAVDDRGIPLAAVYNPGNRAFGEWARADGLYPFTPK